VKASSSDYGDDGEKERGEQVIDLLHGRFTVVAGHLDVHAVGNNTVRLSSSTLEQNIVGDVELRWCPSFLARARVTAG
jgi:hypothetical protein